MNSNPFWLFLIKIHKPLFTVHLTNFSHTSDYLTTLRLSILPFIVKTVFLSVKPTSSSIWFFSIWICNTLNLVVAYFFKYYFLGCCWTISLASGFCSRKSFSVMDFGVFNLMFWEMKFEFLDLYLCLFFITSWMSEFDYIVLELEVFWRCQFFLEMLSSMFMFWWFFAGRRCETIL